MQVLHFLNKMATIKFRDILVNSPGFGAMSLSGAYGPADDEESMKVLMAAYEQGSTFWDTASVYGFGHNEELIGQFLKENPGAREKLFIASKCGWGFDPISKERTGLTNSAEHITTFLEASTRRLGTVPDLYYLHRRDPKTPLEVSIGTLDKLRREGKCKYIGISECSAQTLRDACKIAPIDALQIEYSAFCLDAEQNGVLDAARELGVAVVAWSPLGAGALTGKYNDEGAFKGDGRASAPRFQGEAFAKNMLLAKEFQSLAKDKGCTPAQLALAWVHAQGAIPIPGTKSVSRVKENCAARDVALTAEELSSIRRVISVGTEGARWPAAIMEQMNH